MEFVNLHNHSHYSILDALPSPKELVARAKELGQSAVAITDHANFGGLWEAFKASKEAGIKLIVGAEFNFLNNVDRKEDRVRHIILLAQNAEGYKNLLSLNRAGYENPIYAGRKVLSVIDWELLEKYSSGISCLTACGNGIIGQHINAKNFDSAEADIIKLIGIFGSDNLGLEVQANALNRPQNNFNVGVNQVFTNYHLIKLAEKFKLRVVPTSNTHYLKREDAAKHDVLLAIGAMQPVYSNARLRYNVPDFYMKTGAEVHAFFARNYGEEFATKICENTNYFANKSENPEWIDPKYSNPTGKELPSFAVHDTSDYELFQEWLIGQEDKIKQLPEDSSYLRYKAYKNYYLNVDDKLTDNERKEYLSRIEEELYVLDHQGFSSYMLIVADYLDWARANNILTGYGRGSCGGSVLGYLLGIHKANPIKYGLIFERFHNIHKSAFPDIDSDISTNKRDKLIAYITKKYGQERVSFISNFSRITPKVYARDLARSLEFGGNRQDALKIGTQIADSIGKDVKDKLTIQDLLKSPLFAEYATKRYKELKDYGNILGKPRALSIHAGAQIISKRPLVGLIPLRKDKDGNQVVEYEKNNSEDNGLLKVDVLGLSTLDLNESALEIINKTRGLNLKLEDIDFEAYDKKTYDLISRGDTFGVFQLGTSGGTIDICKKIKPKSIEDLAIITTLARPSSKHIVEDFIKTREGKLKANIPHKSLTNALGKTYGFAIYDESMLQMGKDVAGWSMNESDRIRKMIKDKGKNPDKDKKLREEFIESACKNNVPKSIAIKIWDEALLGASSYTFNKSHAVLYSFLSFISAYLKAHYPIEFLLANLKSEVRSNAPTAEENIDKAKAELRAHGVKILAPDINKSDMDYTLLDSKTLLTGLDALKFVGDDAIRDIIAKRPFKDFNDFMVRTDTKAVRSSAIQALAASGCMDSFGIPRKLIYLYCSDYRKKLQVWLKKHNPSIDKFEFPWSQEQEWTKPELFALEKHYIGESFICSKREAFGRFFINSNHANMTTVKASRNKTFLPSIKGEIKSIFELKVKKEGSRYLGQDMAKITIEDEFGVQCGLTVFPEKWHDIKHKIKQSKGKLMFEPGFAIHFAGTCNLYENEMGIVLENMYESTPPPALPKDLKAKKVAIKDAVVADNAAPLVEQLEDELFTEGLINFDEDPFAVDIY